jgi:pyridoxamine 5'-phosphate oxidase-like protein
VAKVFDGIDERQRAWIAAQPLFFVATAPLAADGHVNLSPKGPIGSLRVLDDHTVAYLDIIGSGAETIAHLRENGRIVVMLCAFDGPPRIVRLHGRGEVAQVGTPRFDALAPAFELNGHLDGLRAGLRSVIRVEVTRIADSCGYVVPLMEYRGERSQMPKWQAAQVAKHGEHAILDYSAEKNERSIDDLPGVEVELLPR